MRYRTGEALGKWTLIEPLGVGGNSEVWRAQSGPETVALKIPKVKNPEAEPYRRFRGEVQVLAELRSHDGILPLLDSYVPEHPSKKNPAWLAMPIADSIQDALGEAPRIKDVVLAIGTVGDTLARLADQGIHHRDVKPGNLFFSEGHWLIGDFGLADFPEKEELTEEHRRMGPLYFIAPEMMESPHLAGGGPADVYSLAKTLWVLATGQNYPPQGELRRDVQGLRLSDSIVHDRIHLLDRLLESSTRHDPLARPSMRTFAEELFAWLESPVEAADADVSDLGDQVSSLLGPALSEEARRRQWVNEGGACFQRVYDHLGSLAMQLRSLDLQGNVTMGLSMGKLMQTLLPRSLATFGTADCLWQNYAAIPIKAPQPYSAQLWVVAGCQVFDDGSADLAAGYLIGSFDFPQDSPWAQTETFDPGSAIAESKIAEMIDGLNHHLRPAVEAFIERIKGQHA